MSSGIQKPELFTLDTLFNSKTSIFIVPRYQRSFAWKDDEVEELWEDIEKTMERKSDYFLGTIVLDNSHDGVLEIIDGQQRLTCLSMIFSSIVKAYKNMGKNPLAERISSDFLGFIPYKSTSEPTPKLQLNIVNDETYRNFVVNSEDYPNVVAKLKDKQLHPSNRLLLQAYRFYLDKILPNTAILGDKAEEEFLGPLVDCLIKYIKIITIPVASHEDASLFFESLNARGKELAISDLVKNRLYMEAGKDVERAQGYWDRMETNLARTPIPEFLRHYWIAKKADEKNLLVREKRLYRNISHYLTDNRGQIFTLLSDLEESALHYSMISDYTLWPNDNIYDETFASSLNDLRFFRISQCHPLLLNSIKFFRSAKEIAKTFRIVANFAFRYYIIGNQSPGNLERETGRIAYGIRTNTYSKSSDIADALRALSPDTTFRADFELKTIDESNGKLARYILGNINNQMMRQSSPIGMEYITNPDGKDINLEHVLPRHPKPIWSSYFSSGVDYHDYIFRIGNLTLTTRKLNDESGNDAYPEKRKIVLDISNFPINKFFNSTSVWGDREIEQRQKLLAKVALQTWKI